MKVLTRHRAPLMTVALLSSSVLALTACGGGDDAASSETSSSEMTSSAPMESESPMETPMESESPMEMDPAANLVGAGCADYAAAVPDGAGSVSGMAQDTVTTAASNNPLLTQLTASVSGQLNPDVNLVDTLDGGEFTVFAPVDEAFAKIDPATIESLKTDADTLTSILTYHVVEGQIAPDAIAGTHPTVNGAELTVEGSGDMLTVNGQAAVICGGVQTANATVYLIDTVLMPPMM